MSSEAKVNHLLIDLDGTLLAGVEFKMRVDFVLRSIWFLKNRGYGIRRPIRALRNLGPALFRPDLNRQNVNSVRAGEAFSRALRVDTQVGHPLMMEMADWVFPHLKRHTQPISGASEFIEWARARLPLVLATNPVWPERMVHTRLKWANVPVSSFRWVTHSDEMYACKPHRQYYQNLIDRLGARPEECLLVGDSFRNDLPATRLGIRVFLLSSKKRKTKVMRSGSWDDLKDWLKEVSISPPADSGNRSS